MLGSRVSLDGVPHGYRRDQALSIHHIARGFGLRGREIRDVSVIPKLFADFAAQGTSEMWNIQISDQVTAPVIRQTIKRGHGNI
jgi:acetolactate synthase-1/2/3 large subunit